MPVLRVVYRIPTICPHLLWWERNAEQDAVQVPTNVVPYLKIGEE